MTLKELYHKHYVSVKKDLQMFYKKENVYPVGILVKRARVSDSINVPLVTKVFIEKEKVVSVQMVLLKIMNGNVKK